MIEKMEAEEWYKIYKHMPDPTYDNKERFLEIGKSLGYIKTSKLLDKVKKYYRDWQRNRHTILISILNDMWKEAYKELEEKMEV